MVVSGCYKLKQPCCWPFKPRLYLKLGDKGKKVKGSFHWMGITQKLHMVGRNGDRVMMRFAIEVVPVELVLRFYEDGRIDGFVDLPIGHFNISGRFEGEIRSNG